MNAYRRQLLLFSSLLLLLALLAAWNVDWMLSHKRAARNAAQDLAQCRSLADEIQTLRDRPAVASPDAIGVQELGSRIEAAAANAGLTPSAVEGVFPQPPQRVADLPYLRKPTLLTLRAVPLQQLVLFLYHLTEGSTLKIRDLRLRAASRDGPEDLWHADATVTYLIYSPAKAPTQP